MIIVIMADQNDVDFGEFLKGNGRFVHSFGPYKGDGAAAFGVDGIGENVVIARLNQEGGVVDEGGPNLGTGHSFNRFFSFGDVHPFGPLGPFCFEAHGDDIPETFFLEFFGIMKDSVFEVGGAFSGVVIGIF